MGHETAEHCRPLVDGGNSWVRRTRVGRLIGDRLKEGNELAQRARRVEVDCDVMRWRVASYYGLW